jgi:hypothetical protein
MRRLIVVLLAASLSLWAAPKVSAERVLHLCQKIGLDATLNSLKNKQATIKIKHKRGISGLIVGGCKTDRCDHANNLYLVSWVDTKADEKSLLGKINSFNQNLLFSRLYYGGKRIILQSDLMAFEGASDQRIVHFIGAYLAVQDAFLKEFLKE